jgi:hypothetical protein
MAVKSAVRMSSIHARRAEVGPRLVTPDDLFDALNGSDLTVSGRKWRIEVYSIRDRAGLRWVQLALNGDPCHMLAVNVRTGDGPAPVLDALSSWLVNPGSTNAILPVASAPLLHLTTDAEQPGEDAPC